MVVVQPVSEKRSQSDLVRSSQYRDVFGDCVVGAGVCHADDVVAAAGGPATSHANTLDGLSKRRRLHTKARPRANVIWCFLDACSCDRSIKTAHNAVAYKVGAAHRECRHEEI